MNPAVISNVTDFLATLEADELEVLKQHVDAGDFAKPLDLFASNQRELKATIGLFTKVGGLAKQLADKAKAGQTSPPATTPPATK